MSFEKLLSFKRYMVLNENQNLQNFSKKISEKLETIKQNIVKSGITEFSEDIRNVANELSSLIKGSWIGQEKELQALQTVGFNLFDMIDGDKDSKKDSLDVIDILNACLKSISENITSKSKGPLNNLAVDKKDIPPIEKSDTMVSEPENEDSGMKQGNNPMIDKSSIPALGSPTDDSRPNS